MKKMMLVIGLSAAMSASATTWYVAPEGNDANDGTSWEAPLATPNEAVMRSARSDVILLSNGVYRLEKPIWVGGAPQGWMEIPEGKDVQDLTFRGLTGNRDDVVIDGQNAVCCFYIRDRVKIFDLSVRNGKGMVDAYGYNEVQAGGLYLNSGSSTVSNCHVYACVSHSTDKHGSKGAGIYVTGSNTFVYDTLVEDCTVDHEFTPAAPDLKGAALHGGGVVASTGSRIVNCIIRNNRVIQPGTQGYESYARGGGLSLEGATAVGCRVYGNACTNLSNTVVAGCGGGISAVNGSVVEDCLVYGNASTGSGGGIYLGATTTSKDDFGVVRNCTVTNNFVRLRTAADKNGARGSGILVTGKGDLVENCLIADNRMEDSVRRNYAGGAIGIGSMNDANTSGVTIRDCIVTGNSAYAIGGLYAFRSSDILVSNCVFRANRATGTIGNAGFGKFDGVDGALVADCWILENLATNYYAAVAEIARYDSDLHEPVTFRNSYIMGNRAKNTGFYMTTYGAKIPLRLEHCTIVSNATEKANGFICGNPWATTWTIPNTYSNVFVDACVVMDNGALNGSNRGKSNFSTTTLDETKPYEGGNFNFTLLPMNITRTLTSTDSKIVFSEENGNIGVNRLDFSMFADSANGDWRPSGAGAAMVDKGIRRDWMGNSRKCGPQDMGDGTYTVSPSGVYGVTVARNNAKPRLSTSKTPTLGCFEWFVPPGVLLMLR